ncbi:hypothetical protein PQX77_004582 [Marasmius sp. AFHP31]|nr:hypothetical protein PQX77_004582 [Marasmius sp. AFHP31]
MAVDRDPRPQAHSDLTPKMKFNFRSPSSSVVAERMNSDMSMSSEAGGSIRKASEPSMAPIIKRTPSEAANFKPPALPASSIVPPSITKSNPLSVPPVAPKALSSHLPPKPLTQLPSQPQPSSSSTPLAPPPSLPASITSIPIKVPESKIDTTREDSQKIWNHRVATLAKYHHHKTEHRKLDERIRTIESILSSPAYSASSSSVVASKKRRDLDVLKKRFEEEKSKMDAAMNQLVESDSWPVGGGTSSQEEEQRVKKEAEDTRMLVETAKELSERLGKMWELAQASEDGEAKTKRKDKGKGKAKAVDEDAMDVDSNLNAGESSSQRGGSVSEEEARKQHEEMLKKLEELESKVLDLENDLIQHQDYTQEQVVHLLDAESKEYRETKVAAAVSDETAAVLDNVQKMDGEIREIDDTLVDLWTSSKAMDQKIRDLEADTAKANKELMTISHRMSGFEERRERDHQVIEALEAAIQMYKEHHPSPPASPFQPEHILPMIEEPVTNAVRSVMKERGDELRSELEKTLQERDISLYQTVWDRLTVTGRTVQVIMNRLQEPSQS